MASGSRFSLIQGLVWWHQSQALASVFPFDSLSSSFALISLGVGFSSLCPPGNSRLVASKSSVEPVTELLA